VGKGEKNPKVPKGRSPPKFESVKSLWGELKEWGKKKRVLFQDRDSGEPTKQRDRRERGEEILGQGRSHICSFQRRIRCKMDREKM